MKHDYHQKVLEVLGNSKIPMDIENVRVRAGIKSWVTSKSILLELLCEGKISGQKTTHSWIFWRARRNGEGEASEQASKTKQLEGMTR